MSELPCFLPCFHSQISHAFDVNTSKRISAKVASRSTTSFRLQQKSLIESSMREYSTIIYSYKAIIYQKFELSNLAKGLRTTVPSPGFLGLNTCKYYYHTFSLLQVGTVTVCFSFQLYGENFCKIFLIAITSYKLVRCSLRNFMSNAAVCRIGYWYFKVWRAKKEANRLRRQICRVSVVRSFFKFKLAENS